MPCPQHALGDCRGDAALRATGPGDGKKLEPSFNVAPTNKVYAVLERGREDGLEPCVRCERCGGSGAGVVKPGNDRKTGRAKTHRATRAIPVRPICIRAGRRLVVEAVQVHRCPA
jgi:hypothetical protein